MKIVVEANIPYIRGILEKFGEVVYLPASAIDFAAVRDADALFVRTRTRCDGRLLSGSSVGFIATATIGTDHIDLGYCRDNGIAVYNAPGCNAPAVAQYVFSVIGNYFGGRSLAGMKLGVVGVGNVGSIVARWGGRLGMDLLLCDPPRSRREGGGSFVGLDRVMEEADVITFHTPLTKEGDDRTFHLADSRFFNGLKRCRLLINSSRGAVVDNAALLEALAEKRLEAAAIDCWENEPQINRQLLENAFVATPHIAGYSSDGKKRATAMALEAFSRHFGVEVDGIPSTDAPSKGAEIKDIRQVMASYDPLADTARLKANPDDFEQLRNNYTLRLECR